jgi:GAF domain-containing protein
MGDQALQHLSAPTPLATNLNGLAPRNASDFALDLEQILTATCKAAVDLLKVDHSGLMVFDSNHGTGHVISEYPAIGTKGLTFQMTGVLAEQRLINFREWISVPDISVDAEFRPVSALLQSHGIRSALLVPLISKDTLIGSLGIDMIGDLHDFTEEEIRLCQLFAQQAAAVIELYRQRTATQTTGIVLPKYPDLRILLDDITRRAVDQMGARDGGVSLFTPEGGGFKIIADYKFPQSIGTTVSVLEGLAGSVIRKDVLFEWVPDYKVYPGHAQVHAQTERFGALLMINLRWQNRTVGVMYLNDKPGREYPSELPPMLMLLASTAAIAIVNADLSHQEEIARERVRFSYDTALALVNKPDSKRVLEEIADQVLKAADATWVRLVVFPSNGEHLNFLAVSGNKVIDTLDRIRPDGITMRVLRSGKPCIIPDVAKAKEELNKALTEQGCRAALCFPLDLKTERGVIWIHYTEPRQFSPDDQVQLQVYLNHASSAYRNTRQIEALEPLSQFTESLSFATNTMEVLQRTVKNAQSIFKADAAVIWPFPDAPADALLIRDAVTTGVDEALREEMRDEALPIGEVTNFVMREGWLTVPDIPARTQLGLPEISLNLLQRLGAMSFEGIGLTVGGEKLAVLYLIHKQRRDFNEDQTRTALTFARHAALALKKARLVDQAAKGQVRATELSALAVLVKLEKTLSAFVAGLKETLGCDAITLFVYDEEKRSIFPLTTMTGVWHQKEVTHCHDAPPESIVHQMLKKDEPYCVPLVKNDPLFRNQRFVKREEIESVCAIPMKVRDHRVGVVFVNYRSPHNFTKPELENIQSLIHQAAVAILNGLRYKEQYELVNLSRQLIGAGSLEELLKFAIDYAAGLLGTDFIGIVILDGEGLPRFKAWKGWTDLEVADYEHTRCELNQTEYTIRVDEPVIVSDYAKEDRFDVPRIVLDRHLKSGVSVPMRSGHKSVGAMLAHFSESQELPESQIQVLSLIANFTAIAVQHRSAIALLSAVIRAADEISKIRLGTEQSQVLDKIIEQAVICVPQSFLGTIQTYDKAKKTLRLESAYPEEPKDSRQIGTERTLDRLDEGPIGITGRAVLTGEPQLVPDVNADPDYFPYGHGTQSELAVPLVDERGDVLGVLNVESKTPAAFNKDDQQALSALAKLVVATIQNAEQFRLVEDSILLAWFGMASSNWGHNVAQKSDRIRNNIKLLRSDLEGHKVSPEVQRILDKKLNVIDEIAVQIRREPLLKLIHKTERLLDVNINVLITERRRQVWSNAPYKRAHYELDLAEENPQVRCNPDWINRMLDILIDNALDAMADQSSPMVKISTRIIEGGQVEVLITDSGPGIPEEIRELLFKQRIEKESVSRGLGTGLLMVRVIAHIYKGKVGIGKTGPTGTTVYVRLPML